MLKRTIKKIPGSRWLARRLGLVRTPWDRDGRAFLLDQLPRDAIGAEIGVHLGDFSAQLLAATSPRELHLIDPWEYHTGSTYKNAWYGGAAQQGQAELDSRHDRVLDRFADNIASGQVTVHRRYSTDALALFPDDYFDWVYIDGNHLYEYVKQDIALSIQKVRPGGYITGDDYTEGGWWQGGVKKAVDEFTGSDSLQLVHIRNGQFVFRVANGA